MESLHISVLLEEAVQALNIKKKGIYIDCTFGRGGHSRMIMDHLGPQGKLFALDKDPEALQFAQERMGEDSRFSIAQSSFDHLAIQAQSWGIFGQVEGVLFDPGVSSPQLDNAQRGFSFRQQGPLDMRMNPSSGISAAQWLAKVRERDLVKVIKEYGEERYAKRIARAIVQSRAVAPIVNTVQLAKIVSDAHPAWEKGKHPATRTFQAIRIYVNQELKELEQVLPQAVDVLAPGGRLVVISFHSLEDQIVKRFIQQQAKGDQYLPDMPVPASMLQPVLRKLGKMVAPVQQEKAQNARSRSARMRVAEKLGGVVTSKDSKGIS